MKLPALTRGQAEELFHNVFARPITNLEIIGIRGYFDPGANKRGIYDDAILLISPNFYKIWNANCDPSVVRKDIAVLQPGRYRYRKGLHGLHHLNMNVLQDRALLHKIDDIVKFQQTWQDIKVEGRILPYFAFRQDGDVTVKRDGADGTYTDTPPRLRMFIDIHRGGYNTTSSEGCQTIHPDGWEAFRKAGFTQMDVWGQEEVFYNLLDAPIAIESHG